MAKKRNPRRRHRTSPLVPMVIALAILLVLLLAVVFVLTLWGDGIADEITVEAGCPGVTAEQFLKEGKTGSVQFITDMSTIDLNTPGDYPVELRYKGQTCKSKLLVRDTVKPTAQIRDQTIFLTQTVEAAQFVTDLQDATDVTISFKEVPDITKAGSQQVTIVLTDTSGNVTELQAELTVLDPVAGVATEVTVEAGCTDLTAEQFLEEGESGSIQFVTDISTLDLNVPGDYLVDLIFDGHPCKAKLLVRDTVRPVGICTDLTAFSTQTLEAAQFVISVQDVTDVDISFKEAPDMSAAGSQSVTILLTDAGGNVTELHAKLTVLIDNQAPVISTAPSLRVLMGTQPDYFAGVTVTDDQDPNPTLVVDDSQADLNTPGTYTIVYTATDAAGNSSRQEVSLTVTDDMEAPKISGAKNISLYLGDTVSYRRGITVTDNKDPNPTLSVDSSKVDLSAVGTYPLVYTATDANGNVTRVEVTVTVTMPPANAVSRDTIYQMVDELLDRIISDGMSPREQVEAIYSHMRYNYGYSGYSDKSDWLQGAYTMMKDGQGDCFNYFALSKLMMERLGIPNIDVRKVKNYEGDSDHYWSLVSVDGGNTYYHLDTTPRVGEGDDFCLVTDAFLDAYSASHNNCHNRDKTLYPATPDE